MHVCFIHNRSSGLVSGCECIYCRAWRRRGDPRGDGEISADLAAENMTLRQKLADRPTYSE
jgi:hypothetical protein